MNEESSIIEHLPVDHRVHLCTRFKHQTKQLGAKNKRQKYEIIASLTGTDGLAAYRGLYHRMSGRRIAWIKLLPSPDGSLVVPTLRNLAESVRAKFSQAESQLGERPDLAEQDDPKLNIMRVRNDTLYLKYAYFGTIMSVPNAWGHLDATRYRFCEAIVRFDPFHVELRGAPFNRRAGLLRSIKQDFGFPETQNIHYCPVDTPDRRERLAKALDAKYFGEKRSGRGKGLGTFAITTDGSVSLLEQIDYVDSQAEHHEVAERTWSFVSRHGTDGYQEEAFYYVNEIDGAVKISDDISETAISNLRRNVLALY